MIEGQISIFDKQRIRLKCDCLNLSPDFKKDCEFIVDFEQENNYICLINNIYYGFLKEECELIWIKRCTSL